VVAAEARALALKAKTCRADLFIFYETQIILIVH
jgi:hypothetical protein